MVRTFSTSCNSIHRFLYNHTLLYKVAYNRLSVNLTIQHKSQMWIQNKLNVQQVRISIRLVATTKMQKLHMMAVFTILSVVFLHSFV